MVSLDLNDVIREAILLVQREVLSHGVSLRTELASALPPVLGDRVQLQQVIINLLMNGVEAMAPITDRPREIVIRSQQQNAGQVHVAVQDSGIGIDSATAEQLFSAFFTTKPSGMGMGLSIAVRSSGPTVADCGYRQTRTTAQVFNLPCPLTVREYRERSRPGRIRGRR